MSNNVEHFTVHRTRLQVISRKKVNRSTIQILTFFPFSQKKLATHYVQCACFRKYVAEIAFSNLNYITLSPNIFSKMPLMFFISNISFLNVLVYLRTGFLSQSCVPITGFWPVCRVCWVLYKPSSVQAGGLGFKQLRCTAKNHYLKVL